MSAEQTTVRSKGQGPKNPIELAVLSLLVGAVAGLAGSLFRLALRQLDIWRSDYILKLHTWGWPGSLLVVVAVALLAAGAAWLVSRLSPEATGSGIPYVETQLRDGWIGNPFHIFWVKFLGGLMAIGGGLALGREGPTVQIGAVIGHVLGGIFKLTDNDRRVLLAAGAGAGLATAFNAPIAGAIFVLEELVGEFDVPISIATLGASAGAIGVARIILGRAPDFLITVPELAAGSVTTLSAHLVLGLLFGFLGIAYSRAILGCIALQARLSKIPVEWRAAGVGVIVGVIGWFGPSLIGGGDELTQQVLTGTLIPGFAVLFFLIRFILGPVSYSAETPGGIFAPMLTLGSLGGLLLGWVWRDLFHSNAFLPQEFAIVGMAAFFTSVVRAPVTGITLVVELTGSSSLLLPMLAAAFASMTVATILKQPPIYTSLRVVR